MTATDPERESETEDLEGLLELLAQLHVRIEAMIERRSAPRGAPSPSRSPPSETGGAMQTELVPQGGSESVQPTFDLPPEALDTDSTMTLVGRTLLVLGGAFLLRALTESETLPESLGVLLGMAYALYWLSPIALPGKPRASCLFHGGASAVIAYPLIWEALRVFGVLGPWSSAAALAVFSGVALFVARRRQFPEIAVLHLLGATATAALLAWITGEPVPYALLLLALGTAMVWLGDSGAWTALGWTTAVVADLVVYVVAEPPDRGLPADWPWLLLLQLGLLVLFVGSYLLRFARRPDPIRTFELLQSALVLLLGFRGAVVLVRRTSAGWQISLAVLLLFLSAVSYGLPTLPLVRSSRLKFFYTTSLGLVFALVGTGLLLDRPEWGWAAIAVGVGWLAHRISRRTLSLHAALLAWAASVSSGAAWLGACALFASGDAGWPVIHLATGFVLVCTALCLWIPVRGRLSWGPLAPLPKALLLAALVWGLGGVVLRLALPALSHGGAVDPAALAAARIGFLSFAAVLLAVAQIRSRRLAAASWLLYPVLALGLALLLFQNLPHGRPSTLFVAFALYGGALVAVARIHRLSRSEGSTSHPSEVPPRSSRPSQDDPP